jgi:hypothetical protein
MVEAENYEALQRALPARLQAAALALAHAERRLGQLLALRAAGQAFRRSEIAGARMTLDRARRDADDLQRIQAALPELLARHPAPSVRLVPV